MKKLLVVVPVMKIMIKNKKSRVIKLMKKLLVVPVMKIMTNKKNQLDDFIY